MDLDEIALACPPLELADGVNEGSTLDITHGTAFSCVSQSHEGKVSASASAWRDSPSSTTQISGLAPDSSTGTWATCWIQSWIASVMWGTLFEFRDVLLDDLRVSLQSRTTYT